MGTRSFWGEVKAMVSLGQVQHPPFLALPKTCTVIGAPTTLGQPLAGTDMGPQMIRDAGSYRVGPLDRAAAAAAR